MSININENEAIKKTDNDDDYFKRIGAITNKDHHDGGDPKQQRRRLDVEVEMEAKVSGLGKYHNDDTLQVLDKYTTIQGDVLIELLGPTNIENSAPIIICVGHGGKIKPDYIQNRSKNYPACGKTGKSCSSMLSDLYTDEIGYKLASKIIQDNSNGMYIDNNQKRRDNEEKRRRLIPYLVICHLHRSKLDVNRNLDIAAQGDPIAQQAWYSYHNYISQAQMNLMKVYGTIQGKTRRRNRNTCTLADENDDDDKVIIEGIPGLLVDVHGYGGKNYRRKDGGNSSMSSLPPPFIHWGYGLKKQDFSTTTTTNGSRNLSLDPTKSTFEFASSLYREDGGSGTIESLICGPFSLGSRFYKEFRTVRDSIVGISISNTLNNENKDNHLLGIGLPSFEYPNPNNITNDRNWCDINMTCPYFSGGYTTLAHTYLDWQQQYYGQRLSQRGDNKMFFSDVVANNNIGNDKRIQQLHQQSSIRMNSVQIEIPKQIRFGIMNDTTDGNNNSSSSSRDQIHKDFVNALSKSLIGFACDLFGRDERCTEDCDGDDDACRKNHNSFFGREQEAKTPIDALSSKL